MQNSIQEKPWATLTAGFVFCLFVSAILVSCQFVPDNKALMPGIEAAELVSQDDFTWSPDLACAPCHVREAQTAASACTNFSGAQSNCITCHDDAQKLTTAHENIRSVKPASKLERTTVETEACVSCHDIEFLAASTIDSVTLVDNNGIILNPHALPETGSHSRIGCTDCHTIHDTTDALETTPKVCQNCHHTDAYECNICHG